MMKNCIRILCFSLWLGLIVGNSFAEEVYCRYELNYQSHYGRVQGDTIYELDRAPWDGGLPTGHQVSVDKVHLLHPSEPKIILGIAGSYKEAWVDKKPFKTVRWFLKPITSAASPGDDVELPAALDEVLVETELVIVIGKTVKNADEKTAQDAIFGYTAGNDIVGSPTSYHRIAGEPLDQVETLLPFGLKIGDGFSPYGPFIYRDVDWNNRERVLTVKHKKTGTTDIYRHNTSHFLYPPPKIVSDLSRVLTLNPGDVIFSGTTKALPARAGDWMEVKVEGFAPLKNRVVAAPQ